MKVLKHHLTGLRMLRLVIRLDQYLYEVNQFSVPITVMHLAAILFQRQILQTS